VLAAVTAVALVGLAVSIALCLYRLLIGPAVVDRLLALDTITTNVLAVLVVLSIRFGSDVYLDSVIVLALLGFVGTVTIAKALMRGRIIE
jgi:multicomponent K+:H+ antiporter subunit F